MPQFLVFQLTGTMASWGDIAVGEQRPSLPVPTKSAILGLIAAAKGIDRQDDSAHLELQTQLKFAVEVFEDGGYLTDYHTTQVPPQVALKNKKIESRKQELEAGDLGTILSTRAYRVSPVYTIALQGEKHILEGVQAALCNPVYTPYLGRKSCPLDGPMYPQLFEKESLQAALFTYVSELAKKEVNQKIRSTTELGACYWESGISSSEKHQYQVTVLSGIRSRARWAFQELIMYASVQPEGR